MKFRSIVNLLLCLTLCLGTISASSVVESSIQTSNWNNGSNSSNGTNATKISGYILSDLKWDPTFVSTLSPYMELFVVGLEGRYIPGKPHPVYVTGNIKKRFSLSLIFINVHCNRTPWWADAKILRDNTVFQVGGVTPFIAIDKIPFTPVVGTCCLWVSLVGPQGRLFWGDIATFKLEKTE